MSLAKTLLLPLLLLSAGTVPAHVSPPPAAESGAAVPMASVAPFDLSEAARIAAGKGRFGATCAAYCHGSNGSGGRAPSLRARSDFDPAATYAVIRDGRRGAGIMPPWGAAFSPEEIWELVAFLKELAAQPAE